MRKNKVSSLILVFIIISLILREAICLPQRNEYIRKELFA